MNKNDANKIIEIRTFEQYILELFSENMLSGTTHTYIGQEATAVALMKYICETDKIFSNHRCHGHYLAYGGPEKKLLAELMSKKSGICEGRGGSQHIHYKNFYTNGVQGGIVANALGLAWADKIKKTEGITVVFIGDGTLGQGLVYESANMASIYECPILFVVEDNSYAMSTQRERAVSGSITKRFEAFGIETSEITSNSVDSLSEAFEHAVNYVRNSKKPYCQVVHNYRLGAHSKGDDYRDENEIAEWRKHDPILDVIDHYGEQYFHSHENEYKQRLEEYVNELINEETLDISSYTLGFEQSSNVVSRDYFSVESNKVLEQINRALDEVMLENNEIVLIGEDIEDPYGGAFRVTKGLSTKYEGRVINTPISEAALMGAGVGMALNGIIPIVEIMFSDFVTLGFDQILNHATKYQWIYGEGINVPLIIRIPSGGGRGYGPTHSQSMEKYLLGIPYLNIVCLNRILEIKNFYKDIILTNASPLVVVENKKMYSEREYSVNAGRLEEFYVSSYSNGIGPSILLELDKNVDADVTLITYGGMVDIALSVAKDMLIEHEIFCKVIVLTQLAPFPIADLEEMNIKGKIVTLEEGNEFHGIGTEIIAQLAKCNIGCGYCSIASMDIPIPNGVDLEHQSRPNESKVKDAILKFVG